MPVAIHLRMPQDQDYSNNPERTLRGPRMTFNRPDQNVFSPYGDWCPETQDTTLFAWKSAQNVMGNQEWASFTGVTAKYWWRVLADDGTPTAPYEFCYIQYYIVNPFSGSNTIDVTKYGNCPENLIVQKGQVNGGNTEAAANIYVYTDPTKSSQPLTVKPVELPQANFPRADNATTDGSLTSAIALFESGARAEEDSLLYGGFGPAPAPAPTPSPSPTPSSAVATNLNMAVAAIIAIVALVF